MIVTDAMVEKALEAAKGAMVDTRRFWTDGDRAAVRAMLESALSQSGEHERSYQQRVDDFMLACFGEAIAADMTERCHRFLEESLELVQSTGTTAEEAHMLVDYVYGRPKGEAHQETGGVMVTLAALCSAASESMERCGEDELARVWTKIDVIREKQKRKPKGSPLPEYAARSPLSTSRPTETHTDHPLRHFDRTCPACLAENQEEPGDELRAAASKAAAAAGTPLSSTRANELASRIEVLCKEGGYQAGYEWVDLFTALGELLRDNSEQVCAALRGTPSATRRMNDTALLTDLCEWGISHKKSCPLPASNFQKNKPCACGRDALLHRLRVAIGRST